MRINECLAAVLLLACLLAIPATADPHAQGLRRLTQQNRCTPLTSQATCSQAKPTLSQLGCCWKADSCSACNPPGPKMKRTNPTCDATAGCTYTCAAGWGDCNKDMMGDGCEVDLSRSFDHCGGCGNSCARPNADMACVNNRCKLSSCTAGFADCDDALANGCEADLSSSSSNCGTCGRACPSTGHVIPTCSAGTCGWTECETGYKDCNNDGRDGCEADLANDPNNCGTCSNNCSSLVTTAPNVVSATCSAGTCSITCAAGTSNCDGNVKNGCEAPSDVCPGPCLDDQVFRICADKAAKTRRTLLGCANGECVYGLCPAGRLDCDGYSGVQLCEVNGATDPYNCGACGKNCTALLAPASEEYAVCSGGTCIKCAAGTSDCDGNADNGCEVNVARDTKFCGTCDNDCTLLPNAANTQCDNGVCSFECQPGYLDCTDAPGCETQDVLSTGVCP